VATVSQPSAAPVRKVTAGASSAAVVTIIVWIVQTMANVEIPAYVSAALVTVVSFAVAYFVPAGATDMGT